MAERGSLMHTDWTSDEGNLPSGWESPLCAYVKRLLLRIRRAWR